MGALYSNTRLSWLRVLLLQFEQSWSLLPDHDVQVDTPLRSPLGRKPGWSVYLYVVAHRMGGSSLEARRLQQWVDDNRPVLR